MPQTSGRFFDELGKLLTDAAGAAHGVRKEIEAVVRGQAERMLRDLDVVQREEFEAVKAITQKAREENAKLQERVRMLESIVADAKQINRDNVCPTPPLARYLLMTLKPQGTSLQSMRSKEQWAVGLLLVVLTSGP